MIDFGKIKAQSLAVRILKTHLETQSLASTYLVTGQPASGKEDIAEAFSRALLCQNKNWFQDCACQSCAKVTNQQHPDVRWIGTDPSVRSIKIEEIRDLLGWTALKPYESEWKIFVIALSDRLTLEAANALLKTLEEPPKHTIFILLVESKSQLLETIQSRAFEIRLKPLAVTSAAQENGFRSASMGEDWIDYFEGWEGITREEFKNQLTWLMDDFRNRIHWAAKTGNSDGAQIAAYLEAIDAIYECKEALEANGNQKLVLTRLTMCLKRFLPEQARSV